MGDVEVVGLRTRDESAIGERGPHIALALFEKIEILADTDDLGGGIEGSAEILDDCRREPDRALLERDIRPVGIAHQPVLAAEDPDLYPAGIKRVDRAPSHLRRQQMFGDHRKIWRRYDPAIEAAHRRRDLRGDRAACASRGAAGC